MGVGARLVVLWVLGFAAACSTSGGSGDDGDDPMTSQGSGTGAAGARAGHSGASGPMGGMPAASGSSAAVGGSTAVGTSEAGGVGGAAGVGGTAGARGGSGGSLASAGAGGSDASTEPLNLRALEVWTYFWSGNNFSYFQIGLCAAGVAVYLFSDGATSERYEGAYVVHDALHVTADFRDAAPPDSDDLLFELELNPASDSLVRGSSEDGYDSHGRRRAELMWPSTAPTAMCP